MDTKVNWDLNILGESPNINVQAGKQWKYRKKFKDKIAEYWYNTSSNKKHKLYEQKVKGQSKTPACKWHEGGI
eukprot:7401324-Heterocapsa_arctica.AAC.1